MNLGPVILCYMTALAMAACQLAILATLGVIGP